MANTSPLPSWAHIDLQLSGPPEAIDRMIPAGFDELDSLQISTLLVSSLLIAAEKQIEVTEILRKRIRQCPDPQSLLSGLLSAPRRAYFEAFLGTHGAEWFGRASGPDGKPSCPLRLLHPQRIAPAEVGYIFGALRPYVSTDAPSCLDIIYRACLGTDDAQTLEALINLYEMPSSAFLQATMTLRPWSCAGPRIRSWAAELFDLNLSRETLCFDSRMLILAGGQKLTPWLLAVALARRPDIAEELSTWLDAIPGEHTWPGRLKIALSSQHGRLGLHARLSKQSTAAILGMKIYEVCALLSGPNSTRA